MSDNNFSLLSFYELEAPYVTEFNRLLQRLSKIESQKDLKSIMVTSSVLSEGKSTLCSFLSITAALKKDMRVLLFDADLRRPNIHKLFNIPASPGLNEVLNDKCGIKGAIVKTSIDNLDILPAGSYCDNPTEIFNPEKIGSLINEVKFYYDLILIDSPPLLPVSDPMLLAQFVDGILMIVKAGKTKKDVVKRAIDILKTDRDKILGVVLNNITHSLPYYYNYDYYNYNYKSRRPKTKDENNRGSNSRRSSKSNIKPVSSELKNKPTKKS